MAGMLMGKIDPSHEESIMWLRGGPDDYPYLREGFTRSLNRARKPRLPATVVAIATLPADAPSRLRGEFERRIWWFRPKDQDDKGSPIEGVKPYSIIAGLPSECT
jgi:hypothetical protein